MIVDFIKKYFKHSLFTFIPLIILLFIFGIYKYHNYNQFIDSYIKIKISYEDNILKEIEKLKIDLNNIGNKHLIEQEIKKYENSNKNIIQQIKKIDNYLSPNNKIKITIEEENEKYKNKILRLEEELNSENKKTRRKEIIKLIKHKEQEYKNKIQNIQNVISVSHKLSSINNKNVTSSKTKQEKLQKKLNIDYFKEADLKNKLKSFEFTEESINQKENEYNKLHQMNIKAFMTKLSSQANYDLILDLKQKKSIIIYIIIAEIFILSVFGIFILLYKKY